MILTRIAEVAWLGLRLAPSSLAIRNIVKETKLEILNPRKGFACLAWSPELALSSHGACAKASLVPWNLGIFSSERCANPHCRPHQFLSSGLSRELLLSAVWSTPIIFVPRHFLALILRNLSKCSRAIFLMSCVGGLGPRLLEGDCYSSWHIRPEILIGDCFLWTPSKWLAELLALVMLAAGG